MKEKKRIRKLEGRVHELELAIVRTDSVLKSVTDYLGGQNTALDYNSPHNHVPKIVCTD